jgi:hypothetical protein
MSISIFSCTYWLSVGSQTGGAGLSSAAESRVEGGEEDGEVRVDQEQIAVLFACDDHEEREEWRKEKQELTQHGEAASYELWEVACQNPCIRNRSLGS